MRIGRSRVAALACAAVGSTAVGAYLLDPAYYDELAKRLIRKMSSSEKTVEAESDELRSDLGAIRSLLATTSLREFLAARHIGRPEVAPPPSDVLVLTPMCTVSEALAKLAERSVVSAPLLREDHGEILGFICVGDILGALMTHMFPCGPCGYASTTGAPEWFLQDDTPDAAQRILRIVKDKAADFSTEKIGTIRRFRGGDGAWLRLHTPETDDPTLLDVIQTYFVDQSSLWHAQNMQAHEHDSTFPENKSNHRVAVYRTKSEKIEITDVFSLSDVTRFLSRWEHIQHCLIPCTIADLGVGTTNVNTVETNITVLRAFAIMHKLGVSALGVVARRSEISENGNASASVTETPPLPTQTTLVGSISASDLRRITPGHFDVLAMTVGEFTGRLHDVSAGSTQSRLAPDPNAAARAHPFFRGALRKGQLTEGRLLLTCSPTATLYDVLKSLATHKVHRMYAVDTDQIALRVVTHTDLVKFFACFAPSEPKERAAATA